MADIKDRIQKIKDYFKEMKIVTVDDAQVIYVIVTFPRGWRIDERTEEKFNVSVMESENFGDFVFYAEIEFGESVIFDAIDFNINQMKAAIERTNLLSAKRRELEELFANEKVSLEELRTLKFSMNSNIASKDIMVITEITERKHKDEKIPIKSEDTDNNKENKETAKA